MSRMRAGDLVTPIRGVRIRLRSDDGLESAYRRTPCTAAGFRVQPRDGRSSSTASRCPRASPRHPRERAGPGTTTLHPRLHRSQAPEVDTRTVARPARHDPEKTSIDLASSSHCRSSSTPADFFIGGRAPLTDMDRSASAIEAASGRRGINRARSAIGNMRVGAESPGETRLRLVLFAKPACPNRCSTRRVATNDGDSSPSQDLAYPAARIALEYEGDIHRVDRTTSMKKTSPGANVSKTWAGGWSA